MLPSLFGGCFIMSMRVALTDRVVASLKPDDHRFEVWDSRRSAFGVRVGKTGKKSFFHVYHWECAGNKVYVAAFFPHDYIRYPDDTSLEGPTLIFERWETFKNITMDSNERMVRLNTWGCVDRVLKAEFVSEKRRAKAA
jgi:hypothetical protein